MEYSEAFCEFCELLVQLYITQQKGNEYEDEELENECDTIRGKMDAPWYQLFPEERKLSCWLSEELNRWSYSFISECLLIGTHENGCGIYKDKEGWEGNIVVNKKMIHIGPYNTPYEAIKAALFEWEAINEMA